MPHIQKLTYLLQLLDDESEVVRDALMKELAAYGPSLEEALERLPVPPDAAQRAAMRALFSDAERWHRAKRVWLRGAWSSWYRISGEMERLEAALALLAEFQEGPNFPKTREPVVLKALLDTLAGEFRSREGPKGALDLARFLFEAKGLRGARSDYHNPLNSSLPHVLRNKQGIPISLACIYMLVGWRVGLEIHGCNWPGHFMTRTRVDGTWMLVDCYNEGHSLDQESFLKMQGPSREAAQLMLEDEPTTQIVVARVLHNLVRAYRQFEEWQNAELMVDLLKDMKQHLHGA